MKTILAPTDFSPSSVNAVRYAADLAQLIDAQLVICTVIQFPVLISAIPVPELLMEDMSDVRNRDLDNLVESIRRRANNQITISRELLTGSIEHQIGSIAEIYKPLCIVMGIRKGKNFARSLFGSTIFKTLNHIPYPLLIIPEYAQLESIKEIGFACDLKDSDTTTPFNTMREWLSLFNARLDIINVSLDFNSGMVRESISLQNHFQSFNPEFHFLDGFSLTDELQDFIRLRNLGLLIVVPKKKHGFLNFIERRHSAEIIKHDQVPILAIPAPAAINAN